MKTKEVFTPYEPRTYNLARLRHAPSVLTVPMFLILLFLAACGKEDIEPVNQPPKITAITPVQGLKENVPAGTVVARFTASDTDGQVTGAHITVGDDKFDVDPIEKTIFIKEGFRPDYETNPAETFKLQVIDDQGARSEEVEGSVSFEDVYEADINYTGPTTFSVKENNAADSTIIEDVFQYYSGGGISSNATAKISGSSLFKVNQEGNIVTTESIDYEALTADQKEKGIMFEIVFEEDGQETGRISGLKYIPENIGPDGLMENMEVKGAYHLEGLHEDIIATTDQEYDDGKPVGDPINFQNNSRYNNAMDRYLNEVAQVFINDKSSVEAMVAQSENLKPFCNGYFGVENRHGLVIPIVPENPSPDQFYDPKSVIGTHISLLFEFLKSKGVTSLSASEIVNGVKPEQALVMKVYLALLANRPKTLDEAMLAAENTIEILQDEDLLNPSEKVQEIIDKLNE